MQIFPSTSLTLIIHAQPVLVFGTMVLELTTIPSQMT
jgi:hypothetical protein